MKTTQKDLSHLISELKEFLVENGWYSSDSGKGFVFFYPPQDLGIQGKYSIALPEDLSKSGIGKFLYEAIDSISEIYGYGEIGYLLDRVVSFSDASSPTRFISRFIDTKTKKGGMPLSSIVSYISNIETGLYRNVQFKLGGETKENKLIAQNFVKNCLFLQTEQGSFIAKVEIPHLVLKQGDLFGEEPLVSSIVCSSLFSGLQFLNEKILVNNDPYDSPIILESAIALFDVELLESLTRVVIAPEMESIEFSLEVGSKVRKTSTGWLLEEKKERLRGFLEFVREQLRGENDLDISGSIVELRSRDPEGSKNYIRVETEYYGDRTFVSATLSNEDYQRALDAHSKKRKVRLKGVGVRLKTQIRISDVTEFHTV